MDILDARAYAEMGLTPMWCRKGAKHPYEEWKIIWYREPSAMPEPTCPQPNIWLRCGDCRAPANIILVDGDDDDAVAWMRANLPHTPIRQRTRRGEHWVYRAPPGGRVQCQTRVGGMLLDIKGDGGGMMAPGSTHPSGFIYAAAEPWARELLAAAPVFTQRWFPSTNGETRESDERTRPVEQRAEQVVVPIGTRDTVLTKLSGKLRASGMDEGEVAETLQAYNKKHCDPPLSESDIRRIATWVATKPAAPNVNQVAAVVVGDDEPPSPTGKRGIRLETHSNGKPRGITSNAVTIMLHSGWDKCLGYDEFTSVCVFTDTPPWEESDKPETQSREVLDADAVRLKNWLARKWHMYAETRTVWEAIEIVAQRHLVHPVRDYLSGLVWDGVEPRLPFLLHRYMGAENNAYTQMASIKWMVSAVARIFKPGCQVDHTLILEGRQGIGKSTALRYLAGDEWFSSSFIDMYDKDGICNMAGVWIQEFAELDCLSRQDDRATKSFLSRVSDMYRAPYKRVSERRLRQIVFAGSTNATGGYLKDDTGNRRYWPVRLGQSGPIRLDDIKRDRDQLWGEAVKFYTAGCPWHPVGDEVALCRREQETRLVRDAIQERIITWARDTTLTKVTVLELYAHLEMPPARVTRSEQTRVANAMEMVGWTMRREAAAPGDSAATRGHAVTVFVRE